MCAFTVVRLPEEEKDPVRFWNIPLDCFLKGVFMESEDRKQTAEDRKHIASVAQWLEHPPFKRGVAGSSPARGTLK